jgi:hypothetical protein
LNPIDDLIIGLGNRLQVPKHRQVGSFSHHRTKN